MFRYNQPAGQTEIKAGDLNIWNEEQDMNVYLDLQRHNSSSSKGHDYIFSSAYLVFELSRD